MIPWRTLLRTHRNVKARGSRVHGRGLFARRDLPEGTYVMEYVGYKVPKKRSDEITEKQWEDGLVYTFELNRRYDLDGSAWWNIARFANHSCDPNCEAQSEPGHIWIVALRDIKKGEEITYDYNFPADCELIPCRCGTSKCSGYVVGKASRGALKGRLRREGLA